MNREEAIRWMEEEKSSFEHAPALNGCQMTKEWQDAIDVYSMSIAALRQQETVTNRNGLNEPLTLDELRKMDGEPVWWWNKSAKPVCTICVWDRFMDEPMFANYDWQSEYTLKLSKYKWLKKCGYKPYRQKPEEDDHEA
ncbi:MAG: hypothetical protein SO072_07555 [Dysosmobacter sp.]|nr:hypothetical protein [Dysosmobacter sp.]